MGSVCVPQVEVVAIVFVVVTEPIGCDNEGRIIAVGSGVCSINPRTFVFGKEMRLECAARRAIDNFDCFGIKNDSTLEEIVKKFYPTRNWFSL